METGESNLTRMISGMNPVLDPVSYVFATVSPETVCESPTLMRFSESEADTLILGVVSAKSEGFAVDRVFRRITLMVHSDLEGVGLTAAFADCLTRHGISANVVAAYYHDHIFIPEADADRAVSALIELARDYKEHD